MKYDNLWLMDLVEWRVGYGFMEQRTMIALCWTSSEGKTTLGKKEQGILGKATDFQIHTYLYLNSGNSCVTVNLSF